MNAAVSRTARMVRPASWLALLPMAGVLLLPLVFRKDAAPVSLLEWLAPEYPRWGEPLTIVILTLLAAALRWRRVRESDPALPGSQWWIVGFLAFFACFLAGVRSEWRDFSASYVPLLAFCAVGWTSGRLRAWRSLSLCLLLYLALQPEILVGASDSLRWLVTRRSKAWLGEAAYSRAEEQWGILRYYTLSPFVTVAAVVCFREIFHKRLWIKAAITLAGLVAIAERLIFGSWC